MTNLLIFSLFALLLVCINQHASAQVKCQSASTCPVSGEATIEQSTHSNATQRKCKNGHCYCQSDFYLDFKKKECFTKEDFLAEKNITKYKVMPGEYCANKSDCIDGLVCENTVCFCPEGCKYVVDLQSCDCGTDHQPGTMIAVAAVGGIINCICWYKIFAHTKKTATFSGKVYSSNSNLQASTVSQHVPMTPIGGAPGPPPGYYAVNPPVPSAPPNPAQYSYQLGNHLAVPYNNSTNPFSYDIPNTDVTLPVPKDLKSKKAIN